MEVALRNIARVPVEEGPGLRDFKARYLKGWEATALDINEAVGVLRTTIAKRAIQCVMAELPAGKG